MKYPTKKQIEKMTQEYSDKLIAEFIGTNHEGIKIDDWEVSFVEGIKQTITLIKKLNKKGK